MIAQEVAQVIPEAVEIPEDDSKDLWSMEYEKLIPVLIKGMQEQIEALQDALNKQKERPYAALNQRTEFTNKQLVKVSEINEH